MVQRVVTDSVAHNGYLEAAEAVAERRGLAYSEVDPPRGTQQFFLGAAHYDDATLNAFQAAGARVRQLWERVESTVTPPRADAEAFARQDTIPLVDGQEDVAGNADAERSEAAGSANRGAESAEERADIIRQQDVDYAAAEAVDRARHERQARERAAASSPPPAEEPNLEAVRRARIARFHHGAGVG